ncbi:4Fe-4S binding protein [Clostridium felsineum]|uniref:4Fe-4S binding protein n=1 Tax=Clostridium felsineum TaxID=36839 RepID=UPI00214D1616|nr:4Fe-4S binding protein [Clostridium felsineum]MCR3759019.1 4Fe-4S binding protein [Clostridium felsineum]
MSFYKEKSKRKTNKQNIRLLVQIFFFVLIFIVAVNKILSEMNIGISAVASASIHAICPFGGVVSIYEFLTEGRFVQKIHESSFILMIIMIITAIGFGPLFCGWVCPFGSFQEWLGNIGKKLFKRRYNNFIPQSIDKKLRFTRYILLFLVIYNTAVTGKLVFQNVDPYYALFQFWTNEVAITAYVVLIIVILLSLMVERPWCKYACPYGAFLGVFNLVRVFKIRRNSNTCVSCKACDNSCPMNIQVSKSNVVYNHQCISCMKCTSEAACPISDTVNLSTGGKK